MIANKAHIMRGSKEKAAIRKGQVRLFKEELESSVRWGGGMKK